MSGHKNENSERLVRKRETVQFGSDKTKLRNENFPKNIAHNNSSPNNPEGEPKEKNM